jgi:hypothetical protein
MVAIGGSLSTTYPEAYVGIARLKMARTIMMCLGTRRDSKDKQAFRIFPLVSSRFFTPASMTCT